MRILPLPPMPINTPMMQIKQRVHRTRILIRHRAADAKMPAAMRRDREDALPHIVVGRRGQTSRDVGGARLDAGEHTGVGDLAGEAVDGVAGLVAGADGEGGVCEGAVDDAAVGGAAVGAEGGGGEEGRVDEGAGVEAFVPPGHGARVVAFVAEEDFVDVEEVAVPWVELGDILRRLVSVWFCREECVLGVGYTWMTGVRY